VINSGDVIPRNALEGLPLHKVDLHVTRTSSSVETARVQLVRRGVQPLQPRELRQLQRVTEPDQHPDDVAIRHTPASNTGTAYVSRQAQLGFKVQF